MHMVYVVCGVLSLIDGFSASFAMYDSVLVFESYGVCLVTE